MAEKFTYVSPGVYRNSKTGALVRSATNPNNTQASKPSTKPAPTSGKPSIPSKPGINPVGQMPQMQSMPSPDAPSTFQAAGQDTIQDASLKNAKGALQTQFDLNQQLGQQQAGMNNPNQANYFGSQTYTIDPKTGQPTITQNMSDAQKQIAQGGEGITNQSYQAALKQLQGGQFGQTFNPNLTARTGTGDLIADRQRIEGDVYSSLTRGLDDQYSKDKNATLQGLANRGIAPGNRAYQEALKQLDQRYDDQRLSAKTQATQLGGQEYERSFGIGETTRANDLATQQGIRNQQFGEVGALSQMGPGLYQQNFQGFTPTQLQGLDVAGTKLGYMAANTNQQQADQNYQLALKRMAAGGGGSAFVPSMLPGSSMGGGSPNPWAGAIAGLGQGIGMGVGSWLAG